jgi:dUTP pyrophosphatase
MSLEILKNLHFKMNYLLQPRKRSPGFSSYEIFSMIKTVIPTLRKRGAQGIVPAGLRMEIPPGYLGLIVGRPEISKRYGVIVQTSIIESNYRGVVCVFLTNLGDEDFHIKVGDVIAKIVFIKVEEVEFQMKDVLSESDNPDTGFDDPY